MCGTISRDGKGRTRREEALTMWHDVPGAPPEKGKLILIGDIPNPELYLYHLDPARGTFRRVPLGIPASPQRDDWVFDGLVEETPGTLETAQIEGLTCRKVLIKTEGGESGYLWISDDIHEVIREEIGTRYSWQLTHIIRGEPDPQLFEIPPDCKEVPPQGKPPGATAPQ
ncbi:MAG: hypothetical protein WAO35_10285 [Terriglobia bacterium]